MSNLITCHLFANNLFTLLSDVVIRIHLQTLDFIWISAVVVVASYLLSSTPKIVFISIWKRWNDIKTMPTLELVLYDEYLHKLSAN